MSTALRKLAQGQPCQMRLPNCCTFDDAQTVLAHVRRGGVGGMGLKPADLCGIWCCANCHAVLDRREYLPGLSSLELDRATLEALCRTLQRVSEAL